MPRTTFPAHNVVLANFQGHHRKALYAIRQMMFQLDLVLELRDARVPLSSINPLFDQVLRDVPRHIVYTKKDLSNLSETTLKSWHQNQPFSRIDCTSTLDVKRLLREIKNRFAGQTLPPPLGTRLMITGMPNAGKSTLLNVLRTVGLGKRKKAARTGQMPGVTRKFSEIVRISENPEIFVYDTPGVFVPRVSDSETMLKLCLVNAVKRSQFEPTVLADYLLFCINKAYPRGGVYPGKPTNNVDELLRRFANVPYGRYNENSVALGWVDKWARGRVAKLMLDDVSPDALKKRMQECDELYVDLGLGKVDHRLKQRFML